MPYTNCNLTESADCERDVNVGISVMALCLGVILALSVAANGMVCFVFYRKSNLLSISNSFVLNLSCSELALSVLVLPFTLTSVFSSSGWIFNDIWCKIQGFIFSVCVFSIQFSLMVISLDRNYAIINSLRYVNVFTQKLANILIAMCWLLSVVLASLPLLNWGSYDYIPNQYTCAINWEVSSEFLTTVCILVFLLPLLVQAICYLSIFKAAISHTKRSSRVYPSMQTSSIRGLTSSVQDPPSDSSDISDVSQNVQVKYQNMECKAVRTILLIAFTYAICWVPYMTVSFLRLRSVTIVSYSDSLAVCFLFLTGVINPVIYVFMNRVMRFEINKFFCGPSGRDSRKSSSGDDNDDFYSTTTMSVSIPKTTTTSSSSNSCQTRSGGKSRRIEMKTIKEEEVELENVFKPGQFPKKAENPSEEIVKVSVDKEEQKPELFLNPTDLYLQRKRIRTKRERMMSIREEASIPIQETLESPEWQYLEDLDLAWNPAISKDSQIQYRRRRSRINSLGARKDETFSRKNRDSGSFLYFEHFSPSKGQHGQNRRSGRGLSVDEALFRFDNFPRSKQNRHHSLYEGMQTSITVPMPDLESCRPHVSDHAQNGNAGSSVELGRECNTGSDPELNRKTPSTSNHVTQTSIKDGNSTHLIHVSPQPKRNCLSA
ncbi:G-protein coupled receptor 161-like [Mizuhopecten yessoensis]|uniref:G-protein coupled receptor 161-like n=1 Tax=Mizuhopecten yessoensis TaxID=6573 RepID=UPI000B458A47|nr:G-protein coupled receptor 161-like [Mizuhopecten yessoensis]XP_021360962.1 G-protein coupled receptor 161-like [Mizuhopecten yessoensis]